VIEYEHLFLQQKGPGEDYLVNIKKGNGNIIMYCHLIRRAITRPISLQQGSTPPPLPSYNTAFNLSKSLFFGTLCERKRVEKGSNHIIILQ
jgi:hypothetical protein